MLLAVGLALVLGLIGAGIMAIKDSPNSPQITAAPQSAASNPEQAPPLVREPQNPTGVETTKSPGKTPQVVAPPLGDDIPGIEGVPLDRAESYLPLPRSRYRHSMSYPDGDSGHREMVVAMSDDGRVTTVLEFTHSKLYPNDPPGLWVNHYVARPDGVYRFSDDDPQRAELWLPSDLALGKTWSNALGDFEIVGFDQTLKVNGVTFQGVLAYRHRSSATDIDQTIWLGLGHGEIRGCHGQAGSEFLRLLKAESEPVSRIDQLMQRHVVNLDKIR